MGIGNYTEDDVKDCARAFTGWTLKNPIPGAQPFGRNDWEFEFRPDQHDYGEKTFLGETGNFDGADIIDIIVRQPATAQFIAKRLYLFFVSDDAGPGGDRRAGRGLHRVPVRHPRGHADALHVRRLPLARRRYYAKVKSPAEHVVGILRLVGDFTFPSWGIREVALECRYMGQDLLNPPSVEGWHTGKEWIDTGILVERVNFAADAGRRHRQAGRPQDHRAAARAGRALARGVRRRLPRPDRPARRRRADPARRWSASPRRAAPLNLADGDRAAEQRVGEMLQLIVATREFQWV